MEFDFIPFIGLPIKNLLFLEHRLFKYGHNLKRKPTPSVVYKDSIVLVIGEEIFDIFPRGIIHKGNNKREGVVFEDFTYISEYPYLVEELIQINIDIFEPKLTKIGYLKHRDNSSELYDGFFFELNDWKKVYFEFKKLENVSDAHISDYTIAFSEINIHHFRLIETNNQMLFHSSN